MPRQARLVIPGVALHIRHRGNNRLPCFHRDGDYLVYLALLQQACAKFECALHAYCLMTNHVHLLLTPGDERSCGAMMHAVAQRYARYFNTATERTGGLWEGRFRSCLVESARHILACYRYIELNPVRAGMVAMPHAYPWSSFRANAGMRVDPRLTPHPEYASLTHLAYTELVEAGIDAPLLAAIREAVDGDYPLASDGFKSAIESRSGRRVSPGKAGRPAGRRSVEESREKSVDVPDLFSGGGAF